MAYKTLEDFNGTTMDQPLLAAAEAVPAYPALLLFSIFSIITFGTFFTAIRRFGKGDLPASATAGGFVSVICAVLLSLIPNFMPLAFIIITIIFEILFVWWLLGTRNIDE